MNILKKILIPVLLFSSIFTIAACGKKKDKKKTQEIITHEATKGKIGKDGGTLSDKDSNLSLNIPKDALDKDTEISLKYVSNSKEFSSNISQSFLGGVEYGPSGTKFNKEVEATVRLTKAPTNATISVFCYNDVTKIWDYVTSATVASGVATFKINHFSRYEILDKTPDMTSKYRDLVLEAKRTNKNDAWITQSFYDYLVDEKHVLDYYEEFEGYYYYGCGLKIFGKYQIDGVSGNAEDLSMVWGDSNKKGDTYGRSTVAGETVDSNTFNKTLDNNSENKELIDVTITIEYKMITPQFTMSSSKTTLSEGESADVSLYCHYSNPTNPIYPDFALPGYYLTITSLSSSFTVDKTSVTTDNNGRATFKVTCKEEGEEGVVKAIFDVSGEFGTHAEGIIHFGSEDGYKVTGHVAEEYEYVYTVPEIEAEGATVVSNGKVNIKVEYDISGTIKEEDGNLSGSISVSNVSINVTNTEYHFYVIEPEFGRIDGYYYLLKSASKTSANKKSYDINGTISNDSCELKITPNDYIISVDTVYAVKENGAGKSYYDEYPMSVAVKNSEGLLLPFSLTEGERTYNDNKVIDSIEVLNDGHGSTSIYGYLSWLDLGLYVDQSSIKQSTTQTITIAK